MSKQELKLEEIFDLIALRVVVSSVANAITRLASSMTFGCPCPAASTTTLPRSSRTATNRFNIEGHRPDRRAARDPDPHQAMHRLADFGIMRTGTKKAKSKNAGDKNFEKKMSLLRQQLFDWQADAKEPGEFLRSVVS